MAEESGRGETVHHQLQVDCGASKERFPLQHIQRVWSQAPQNHVHGMAVHLHHPLHPPGLPMLPLVSVYHTLYASTGSDTQRYFCLMMIYSPRECFTHALNTLCYIKWIGVRTYVRFTLFSL